VRIDVEGFKVVIIDDAIGHSRSVFPAVVFEALFAEVFLEACVREIAGVQSKLI
jgi:hypothetical protein